MTESEEKFANEIAAYLQDRIDPNDPRLLGTRTDADLKAKVKAASLLLVRFAPGRYRWAAQQMAEAPLPYRIKELNNTLEKVYREVTRFGTVEKMEAKKAELVDKAKTLVENLRYDNENDNENDNDNDNDNDYDNHNEKLRNENENENQKRGGKRADHDALPRRIQALYEDNLNLLQSQRAAHEKAKVLVAQLEKMVARDAAICDIEEACNAVEVTVKEIIDTNERRLENWRKYDEFDAQASRQSEGAESVVVPLAEQNDEALLKYMRKASDRLLKYSKQPGSKQLYEENKAAIKLRYEEMQRRGLDFPVDSAAKKRLVEAGFFNDNDNYNDN